MTKYRDEAAGDFRPPLVPFWERARHQTAYVLGAIWWLYCDFAPYALLAILVWLNVTGGGS